MKNKTLPFLKSIMLLIAVMLIATPDGHCKKEVKSKVARDFKKFGKDVKGALKKIEGDAKNFLKGIKNVMPCIPKVTKGLVHLAANPKDKNAFNSLRKCINNIKQMSTICVMHPKN